jgi:penicillin G amidase
MPSIHRDLVSIPGIEFRDRIRSINVSGAAAKLRDRIVDWNGEMTAESRCPVAYVAVRTALTRIVTDRSGLRAIADGPYSKVSPGIFAETQLWWSIPQLLRANDTSLLGGATWDELLAEALVSAAEDCPAESWSQVHRPVLRHPLSAIYPEHAPLLDKPCAIVGGDNDTVFATGYIARLGTRAASGALSRYVFDVGAWDNCSWVVFHGASGHTGSPWYDNQNPVWAAGELVPMLYDWDKIAASAEAHQELLPS